MPASPSPLIHCPECGRSLPPPGPRQLSRCPRCGTDLTVPPGAKAGNGRDDGNVLIAGSQQDDGQAYGVLGKRPPPPCPGCGEPLAADAPVCPNCNFDRAANRRLPKTFAPFDQTWEAGFSFRSRILIFAGCQVINIAMFMIFNHVIEDVPETFAGWFGIAILQEFLLGTYDRVRVTRTSKGKVTITKTWRVLFVPLATQQLEWRELEEVGVRRADHGILEWFVLFALLGYFCLPGILWWWYGMRPNRVTAALLTDGQAIAHRLYSGTDEDKAEEIAAAIHELTGLPHNIFA